MNSRGFLALRAGFAVGIASISLIWSSVGWAEPFATVLGTRLDSDIPGNARFLDPNLVNPIGIAMSGGSPDWVANGGSGVATLYNTFGQPQALVVSVPSPGNPTGGGAPTGDVFNIAPTNTAFQVTDGVHTASALFMFATTGGTIVGWSPGVDPTGQFAGPNGVSTFGAIAVNQSAAGADYRGLAIANNGVATLLYAANFGQGTIDVFDEHFAPASLAPGAFKDPNLPAAFVPFNVQQLGGHVFVTYAQKNGGGGGVIDEFNLDGTFVARIASNGPGGPLEAPWGLALAPSSFGSLAGMLLVGNHGDGIIDVFDPAGNNALLAELADPAERLLAIDGLWGLAVGNGTNGGNSNSILFTAGINGGRDGMFGSLTPVLPGTPVGDFGFVAVGVPWPSSLAMVTIALIALGFRRRYKVIAGALLVAATVQLTPAVSLAAPLPPGVSDEIVFAGPNALPNRQIIAEGGGPETEVVFACDSSICIPGASVALTEPGQPSVVSDLLTVSGGGALAGVLAPQDLVLPVDILFRSDSEGGPSLTPPAGTVFLAETGDRQNLSALIFLPAAVALGFQLTVQSDIEAVSVPELSSMALLIIGALAAVGCRRI